MVDKTNLDGIFTMPPALDKDVDIGSREVKNGDPKIKENWQKIEPRKFSQSDQKQASSEMQSSSAIMPSRTAAQEIGGNGFVTPKNVNSIFNPFAIEEYEESDYTKHLEDRKKIKEIKKEKNNDWEKVSAAPNTDNTPPALMGFTPNKSAFKQAEIPKVTIPEVERLKLQTESNKSKAQEALQAKMATDSLKKVETEKQKYDTRSWEEVESEKIANIMGKTTKPTDIKIKLASDFVKVDKDSKKQVKKEGSLDFSGIFKMPEFIDKNIKKQSNIKTKRTGIHDDKSWETLKANKNA